MKADSADLIISIGVVGASRIGKSSHINAHLGYRACKTSAVRETTLECTPFAYPGSPRLLIWDLPGYNTLNFERERYLATVPFNRLDFFLLLTDSIITDDLKWISNLISESGKKFHVVRTKIDDTIRESRDNSDNPRHFNEERVLIDQRNNLRTDLRRLGLDDFHRIFLVNNKKPDTFDFAALRHSLTTDLPSEIVIEHMLKLERRFQEIMTMNDERTQTQRPSSCVIS